VPFYDIFNATQMNELKSVEKLEFINTVYNAAVSRMLSENVTDDERKQLGHSLDDILFSCLFNNQPCGPNDFVWHFDRYFGNCFIFNAGYNETTGEKANIKKSLLSGSQYGLELQYYVGFNEKLSLLNSIFSRGGFAKIENSSFLLDDSLDGIQLTPGDAKIFTGFKLPNKFIYVSILSRSIFCVSNRARI